MDIQKTIQRLEKMKDYLRCEALEVNAIDLAIKALEGKYFFENEVSHIHEWFADNKDCLLDSAMIVSTKRFEQYSENEKIDDVDLEFIVSDIVDEIQKGILNVLSTYMDKHDEERGKEK